MTLRHWAFAAFVPAALVVLYFTLRPGQPGVMFMWSDKVQHCAAYAGLAFLAGLAALSGRQALVFAVLLAVAGYGLEWVQMLVGRSYDLLDALANIAGCAIGFALSLAVRRIAAGRHV